MGLLDRIRSGLRTIGEKLNLIERKAPQVKEEIRDIRKDIKEMEKDIRPAERTIVERSPGPERFRERPIQKNRYRVIIQWRPENSKRKYKTFDEKIEAISSDDAIAIAKEQSGWEDSVGELGYTFPIEATRERD